jgi:protein TonB
VLVGTDGRASSVTVLNESGFGFGRAARRCAMGKSYSVGKDRFGKPVAKTTRPIAVTFSR